MNPIKFHGTGRQFFNIWIVNVLLTIVTLGIYAAWAHVRTKRYFYGNTELAGDRFEYLATPKQVLVGYLVMFVLLLLTSVPVLGALIVLILFVGSPWLIQRSLRFNAQMTRFRGIRFDFKGSVRGAFVSFIGKPALAFFSLVIIVALLFYSVRLVVEDAVSPFLLLPCIVFICSPFFLYATAWTSKGVHTYLHNNYFYGSERFNAEYSTNTFFKFSVTSTLIVIAILVLPLFLFSGLIGTLFEAGELEPASLNAGMLIGFMVLYIAFILAILVSSAYYVCKTRNYTYSKTLIGLNKKYHLNSRMTVKPYVVLLVSNFLMVLFSLGLLSPFARVRLAQYLANATQVYGDLDELTTKELAMKRTSAIGDAVATGFDFNVNF